MSRQELSTAITIIVMAGIMRRAMNGIVNGIITMTCITMTAFIITGGNNSL